VGDFRVEMGDYHANLVVKEYKMRHQKNNYHFNRDANSRKALFLNLAKSLIEKEQIKTTAERAKALRGVVEPMITRAKTDSVANRRLAASELQNDDKAVKKLFSVLGPRYADRKGGYTRVLRAGIRYGDAADMAIIEFVGRDVAAKAAPKKSDDAKAPKTDKAEKAEKKSSVKVAREAESHVKAAGAKKEVSVKRRATGK
jgi:large subunit ribosomal protein L17